MPKSQEERQKFEKIQELLNKIDKSIEQKGHNPDESKRFNLASVGHEMMRANSEFYQSGVVLGDESFSTLATESENKRDLAMSFLAMIYSTWTLKRKPEFDVLEIGAGSGDLMKEIFTIRDEVMKSDRSSVDHKLFFESLKFKIVDFPQMIEIQKRKLGENADEVNFIPQDISKNLIRGTYDFIYGNEIPDTQRVDFLEVKIDKETGEKKHYLRAIKTSPSGQRSEVLAGISSSPEIITEIGENLYPIDGLEAGVYKLQFGFHALIHNITQSLKQPLGGFMLPDYYNFTKDHSSRDLIFSGRDGINLKELQIFAEIAEPGRQLIKAKEMYGVADVTYSPNVGMDTSDSLNLIVANLDNDDRGNVIMHLKFSEKSIEILQKDPLFGKNFNAIFNSIGSCHATLMPKELSICRTLGEIKSVENGGVENGQKGTPSPSSSKPQISPNTSNTSNTGGRQ